jgi:hypothetical protein
MAKKQRSFVGHPNLILETLREIADERGWLFGSNPKDFRAISEWDNAHCVFEDKNFRTRFEVQQMPGCCAVLIAHHVMPEPYSVSVFDESLEAIERAAFEAGFGSLMMAQVVGRRGPGVELWANCEAAGWLLSDPFINAKSGNEVVYLTKNLMQEGKREGLEIAL